MLKENILSRITIDISKEAHKRLKAMAALYDKTMREIIIEAIDKHIYHRKKSKRIAPTANSAQLDRAISSALEKYSAACKKITKVS